MVAIKFTFLEVLLRPVLSVVGVKRRWANCIVYIWILSRILSNLVGGLFLNYLRQGPFITLVKIESITTASTKWSFMFLRFVLICIAAFQGYTFQEPVDAELMHFFIRVQISTFRYCFFHFQLNFGRELINFI